MINEHLDQLQTTLEQAEGMPESTRAKLLELLAAVREESTDSAAEKTDSPEAGEGMTGLLASVEQLEASHPEIASLINQVAITLSRMGI